MFSDVISLNVYHHEIDKRAVGFKFHNNKIINIVISKSLKRFAVQGDHCESFWLILDEFVQRLKQKNYAIHYNVISLLKFNYEPVFNVDDDGTGGDFI